MVKLITIFSVYVLIAYFLFLDFFILNIKAQQCQLFVCNLVLQNYILN